MKEAESGIRFTVMIINYFLIVPFDLIYFSCVCVLPELFLSKAKTIFLVFQCDSQELKHTLIQTRMKTHPLLFMSLLRRSIHHEFVLRE